MIDTGYVFPSCFACCGEAEIVLDGHDGVKRVVNVEGNCGRGSEKHAIESRLNLYRPKIAPISPFEPIEDETHGEFSSILARLYHESRLSDGCLPKDVEWLKPITDLLAVGPEDLGAYADKLCVIWQLGSEESYGSIGTYAASHQQAFDDKLGDAFPSEDIFKTRAQDAGVGIVCKKGLQHGDVNQDNYLVFVTTDESSRKWTIAGVFDGHGTDGHAVSLYTARMFLWCILKLIEVTKGDLDAVTHHLHGVFGLVHASISLKSLDTGYDVRASGTTATVVLLRDDEEVVCASVGDSRCIVCDLSCCVDLSSDHKPNDEHEKARILRYGGRVIRPNGDTTYRVTSSSKPPMGLAMSRSIGDVALHEFGVTWEPSVTRRKLGEACSVTLCSDGIWEFMSSRDVADMLQHVGQDQQMACETLCLEAQGRWIEQEGNIVDDTTAICIFPGKPPVKTALGD